MKIEVLSFGGGQDSTAILLKLIHSKSFYKKYVGDNHLIVIMSDTGNEFDYTYDNVKKCQALCKEHDIPFFFLTPDMGFHTPAWSDLMGVQNRPEGSEFKETMVQLKTKSCTDKLKLVPIYKFLDEVINRFYGYGYPVAKVRGCGKKAMTRYGVEHGDINVMIGFSKGEEKRVAGSEKIQANDKQLVNKTGDRNYKAVINRVYPLIEEGMNRDDCQEFLAKVGFGEVMPSNCMACPYQDSVELYWLSVERPEAYQAWVEAEDRHFKRWEGTGKKVRGAKLEARLPVLREKGRLKAQGWSKEELWDYKKSHGCQSNSF